MIPMNDRTLLRQQCCLDGQWSSADEGHSIPVTNPATGMELGTVPRMGGAETRRAIQAAEAALPSWKRKTAQERSTILRRWFDLIMETFGPVAPLFRFHTGIEEFLEVKYLCLGIG